MLALELGYLLLFSWYREGQFYWWRKPEYPRKTTLNGVRCGRNHMIVRFSTTSAINAFHHWSCEFESHSWWGVFDTTLCDKVCQWLAAGRWFSLGTLVSSTNKTDPHDITRIVVNTLTLTLTCRMLFEVVLNLTIMWLRPQRTPFNMFSIQSFNTQSNITFNK
jgi:hypothetical protein